MPLDFEPDDAFCVVFPVKPTTGGRSVAPTAVASRPLQPGSNVLEVRVVNLWPNRLIGDARQFPVDNNNYWTAEDELLPSGLIGPVFVEIYAVRIYLIDMQLCRNVEKRRKKAEMRIKFI